MINENETITEDELLDYDQDFRDAYNLYWNMIHGLRVG
jgi:hypothetical protein